MVILPAAGQAWRSTCAPHDRPARDQQPQEVFVGDSRDTELVINMWLGLGQVLRSWGEWRSRGRVILHGNLQKFVRHGRMGPSDQVGQGENQIMSDETILDRKQVPLDVLERIDQICDQFEANWEAEGRPRIEEYLDEFKGSSRPILVRDLLAAELDARRRRGERPRPAEYRGRLPNDAPAIAAAFRVQPEQPDGQASREETVSDFRRSLLFVLLAYQNGLISQATMVDALGDFTKDRTSSVADSLGVRDYFTPPAFSSKA